MKLVLFLSVIKIAVHSRIPDLLAWQGSEFCRHFPPQICVHFKVFCLSSYLSPSVSIVGQEAPTASQTSPIGRGSILQRRLLAYLSPPFLTRFTQQFNVVGDSAM